MGDCTLWATTKSSEWNHRTVFSNGSVYRLKRMMQEKLNLKGRKVRKVVSKTANVRLVTYFCEQKFSIAQENEMITMRSCEPSHDKTSTSSFCLICSPAGFAREWLNARHFALLYIRFRAALDSSLLSSLMALLVSEKAVRNLFCYQFQATKGKSNKTTQNFYWKIHETNFRSTFAFNKVFLRFSDACLTETT